MAQERIECPFCCEFIVRGAAKCRFCGEWFSEPEPHVNKSRSIEEIGRPGTHRESHRGAFEEIRKDYLATMVGTEGRSQPVETTEHQTGSPPKTDDGSVSCTVEALDGVGIGRQNYSRSIENIRPHVEPMEEIRHEEGALPGDGGHAVEQDEGKEALDASPARVAKEIESAERLKSSSFKKRARIPWLRALMILLYVGIVAALAVTEFDSRGILRDARAKESAQEYDEAFGMYRSVLDGFPFSFGTIETRRGLDRLCQSQAREMPKPSWFPAIENLLGSEADMPEFHLLPFAAWPLAAVLLLLVFLTRIFRPGVAFLALLLMAVAIAGSVAQLAWYGSISLPTAAEAAQGFMRAMPAVYFASYLLLVLTALMTLTATAKRPIAQISKPEELWTGVDRGRE